MWNATLYIFSGAGVVTTRAHVHYIVTEYGIAYLFGKNLRQRAYEMIKIAHPSQRELLEKAAFERFKCMPSPWDVLANALRHFILYMFIWHESKTSRNTLNISNLFSITTAVFYFT